MLTSLNHPPKRYKSEIRITPQKSHGLKVTRRNRTNQTSISSKDISQALSLTLCRGQGRVVGQVEQREEENKRLTTELQQPQERLLEELKHWKNHQINKVLVDQRRLQGRDLLVYTRQEAILERQFFWGEMGKERERSRWNTMVKGKKEPQEIYNLLDKRKLKQWRTHSLSPTIYQKEGRFELRIPKPPKTATQSTTYKGVSYLHLRKQS